ncbi:MAG TPA: hypothetical protein VII94_05085 [Candidatus Saccharimonadales bacterium]
MNEEIKTTTEGLNVPSHFTETQKEDFGLGVITAITANVHFDSLREAQREFAEKNAKHPYTPNETNPRFLEDVSENDADFKVVSKIANELMPSRELYDGPRTESPQQMRHRS